MSITNESRYDSNEWISPIEDEAIQLLSDLNYEDAIQVAVACHLDIQGSQIEVPYSVIFSEDSVQKSLDTLLKTIKTPSGLTQRLNVEFQEPIARLNKLLRKHNASEGSFALQASYHIIMAVSGKQTFFIYKDYARDWPQYAREWIEDLSEQYPDEKITDLVANHELGNILSKTIQIAALHYKNEPQVKESESTKEYLERVFLSFEIFGDIRLGSEGGFKAAAKALLPKFDWYRINTYGERGLIYRP